MATFQQVLERMIKSDNAKVVSVNQNMMQVSVSTKKNPGFIKTAVSDELAQGLLRQKRTAFIIHIDGDELNEIAKQIDEESKLLDVYCTDYPDEGVTRITQQEYDENPGVYTILPEAIETNESA